MKFYFYREKWKKETNSSYGKFNELVSGFMLIELPLKQTDYTWSHQRGNPSFSKLDPYVVTE